MIDLLPLAQKKMIHRMRIMRVAITSLIAVIVLCIVSVALLAPTFETIRSHEQALQSYTRKLEAEGIVVSAADVASLQSRTKVLREKLTAKLPVSPLLYIGAVREHAVNGVKLTGFEISNPEKQMLQVRGTASNRQALQAFITGLQADKRIAAVDSPITNFVKSAESEFALTVTFNQL